MSWSIICQRIIYSSSNSVLRYYQSWSFYKLVWVHLDRSYFKHYIVHRKSELWCSGILNANFILDKALFYTMIYIKQIIISHNFNIKKRYSINVCYLLLWSKWYYGYSNISFSEIIKRQHLTTLVKWTTTAISYFTLSMLTKSHTKQKGHIWSNILILIKIIKKIVNHHIS